MPFRVREIFPTLQGEGSRTGQPAVFLRLSGCNLWSGLEKDRPKGAGGCAAWCDTDFHHGTPYEVDQLVEMATELALGWKTPLLVLTGGEPLLQLGSPSRLAEAERLLVSLLRRGWETALETNGTRPLPRELAPLFTHVTVSPKPLRGVDGEVLSGTEHLQALRADDLKIVVPTPFPVAELVDLYRKAHLYFQPMDQGGDRGTAALHEAVRLARHYGGRVSLQVHKLAGLP